jgi:hypothetical protein
VRPTVEHHHHHHKTTGAEENEKEEGENEEAPAAALSDLPEIDYKPSLEKAGAFILSAIDWIADSTN